MQSCSVCGEAPQPDGEGCVCPAMERKPTMQWYETLNDAAERGPKNPSFLLGSTQIWFAKPGMMLAGYQGWLPGVIQRTHRLVGSIAEADEENIFAIMQGEYWSPQGDAAQLIRGLGLSHTSMSVGDIIVMSDVAGLHGAKTLICRPVGFDEI